MEEQSPPAPPAPPSPDSENPNVGKKIAIIIGIIVILIILGSISYFVGLQSGTEKSISPTPVPFQIPSPTPIQVNLSTPTPTVQTTSPTPTPSPSPTPIPKSEIIQSTAELDGFRSSNGGGNKGVDIRAGRNVNLATRGFVSFDLGDLPSGAEVIEAKLRIYQTKTVGSPYTVGGALLVDHLTYGDSLDNSDYASPALLSGFATMTKNNKVEWKSVDVTAQLKDDLANARSKSQYRLHFTTEVVGGNLTGDFAYFEAADNSEGTGSIPQLIVKYN